jgi:hypothetical protein
MPTMAEWDIYWDAPTTNVIYEGDWFVIGQKQPSIARIRSQPE